MAKEHKDEEGTSTAEENGAETEADPSPEEKVAEVPKTEVEADAGKAKKAEKGAGKAKAAAKAPAPKKPAKEKVEKVVIPVERTKPLRERKQVEKFVVTPFKKEEEEVVILQGKGLAFKDIPNVVYKLGKIPRSEDLLSIVHNLMYKKRGKQQTVKKNILDFSGYVWEDEEKDRQAMKDRLERYPKDVVAEVLDLFDLPVGGKKEELVTRAIEFLEKPSIASTVLLEEKEAKKKRKSAAKSPRSKKPAKGGKAARKDEGEEEEEDEDEEEDAEEEAAPAKKKARATPVKAVKKAAAKSPAKGKPAAKPKASKASKPVKEKATRKKAAKEEAEDSDSEDDAPLVKPKSEEKPSKQELADAIKEILETADLEKISKKAVRAQVAEKFSLEKDARKDEINELINEGVAAKQEA